MTTYKDAERLDELVRAAESIVIVQADNPDADSLGSALALEAILTEMGKQVHLYCGVDMPGYLRYLRGWDRIQNQLPKQFSASIIVDASTTTLLEKLSVSGQSGWLSNKPCAVLDHHATVEKVIPYSSVMINDSKRASAGELIYILASQLKWPKPVDALEFIMTSILGDTQGLSNQLASSETYRVMAELIDAGVDRSKLEELRREFSKMPPEIFKYKAELIKRTEFVANGRVGHVTISQSEINEFSPLYNPAPLIQGDLLQTAGVMLAIVFKHYADGKVTAAIRSNAGTPLAGPLAEHMGGGGHAFASGFKIIDNRSFETIKNDCLDYAEQLLNEIKE